VAIEHDPVGLARRVYSRLIEPGLTEYDGMLDLPNAEAGAGEVADILKGRFAAARPPKAIMIRVGGKDVGVSTLAAIKKADGYAGKDPGFASAERSELPGTSTRYRAIVFSCKEGQCDAKAYRSFYDPDDIPVCPVAGHGLMELVR
jgi:hypothetical protein